MNSIKIRAHLNEGKTQIKLLITHPMSTGRAIDKSTTPTEPAHFIQSLTVRLNEKVIVSAEIGSGIAKDPYFAFTLAGGQIGDTLSVDWLDNLGQSDSTGMILK